MSLTTSSVALLLLASLAPAMENLILNADFSQRWSDWMAAPAVKDQKATLVSEADNTFLRLNPGCQVQGEVQIPLDPSWTRITVSGRIRVAGLVVAEDIAYGDARFAHSFVLADGKRQYAPVLHQRVDTGPEGAAAWKTLTKTVKIPAGALRLEIACAHFGTAGVVDFDDLQATPITD